MVLQSVRYASDLFTSLTHGDGQRLMALGGVMALATTWPCLAACSSASAEPAQRQLCVALRPGGADYLRTMRNPATTRAAHAGKPLVIRRGRATQAMWAPVAPAGAFSGAGYLLSCAALAGGLAALQRRQWRLWHTQGCWSASRPCSASEGLSLRRLADNLPGSLYRYQLGPDSRNHFPTPVRRD